METIKQVTILETSQHDNIRSEFLIPRGIYSNNARVTNFGVSSDGLAYSLVNGVYSIIKNIFLYDDMELVNSCYNVYKLAPFIQVNHKNSRNLSMYSTLTKSTLEFLNRNNDYKIIGVTTATGNESLSYLSLNELLPFFNAMSEEGHNEIKSIHKDTSLTAEQKQRKVSMIMKSESLIRFDLMKRPRLVIEYNYDLPSDKLFVDSDNKTFNFNKPTLILDRIMDDEGFDKNVRLKYLEYLHDNYFLNSNNADSQSINVRMRGCENKFVHKLYLLKSHETRFMKGDNSLACLSEKLNLKVNNVLHFPEDLDTSSKHSYVLTNSIGDVTQMYGGNKLFINGQNNLAGDSIVEAGLSNMDYFVCDINDYVTSLYLIYSRDGDNTGSDYTKELDLYLFYLSERVMISNGTETKYTE